MCVNEKGSEEYWCCVDRRMNSQYNNNPNGGAGGAGAGGSGGRSTYGTNGTTTRLNSNGFSSFGVNAATGYPERRTVATRDQPVEQLLGRFDVSEDEITCPKKIAIKFPSPLPR